MSHLELKKLTDEQCLKITQGIVDDLIRAINLGNYSLIWRYFSHRMAKELDAKKFLQLHEKTSEQYENLQEATLIESNQTSSELEQQWQITSESGKKAELTITLIPVKEFLAIEQFSLSQVD